MDNECQAKYEFTPHRKQYLLKVKCTIFHIGEECLVDVIIHSV